MMELRPANYKTSLWNCPDWVTIPGTNYQCHWRGAIRNSSNKLLLRPGKATNGYLTVAIYGKTVTIHRQNAIQFIPNPENKRCVNHKDGNKLNNHKANLEWATHGENNSHAIRTGLKKSIWPAKGVIQMDLEGNEIARYHSSEHAPGFISGCICHVCNGKRFQHGGFRWKWADQ